MGSRASDNYTLESSLGRGVGRREGDDETSGGREGMEEYRVCGSTGSELTGV